MDFELTAEQQMLKDLCRDFARKEIAPYADEWFDAEYFPTEVFKKMADLQLMGLLIPEQKMFNPMRDGSWAVPTVGVLGHEFEHLLLGGCTNGDGWIGFLNLFWIVVGVFDRIMFTLVAQYVRPFCSAQ